MRNRSWGVLACLGLLAVIGGSLAGCKGDSSVSASDEERFKHPPKDMPAEASKYMREHSAQAPKKTP